MLADLQGMEKGINSSLLTRNTVSSKRHHCEASQKWLDAVPECFGVYLTHLQWRKWLVTELDAYTKQFSPCKPKDCTYCLGNIEPTVWLSHVPLLKKAKKSVFSLLCGTPQRDYSCATLPKPNVSRQGKGNIASLPCKAPSSACGKPRSMAHTIANSQEYSFPSWICFPRFEGQWRQKQPRDQLSSCARGIRREVWSNPGPGFEFCLGSAIGFP